MEKDQIYIAGGTAACRFTGAYLQKLGLPVSPAPGANVGHLILDVPSFGPEGQLRMGGAVEKLLKECSWEATVYGGNLNHPALATRKTVDFLQCEDYLSRNAYITAECALDVALPYLSITVQNCPVLVIGWGRIGKCLSRLLKAMGAQVTIASRKESNCAILRAMGYEAGTPDQLANQLGTFRLIYNTAPELVYDSDQTASCREDCVIIELASKNGIEHENTVIARGLPGIHMPESSGILIAETFLRYYDKEVDP